MVDRQLTTPIGLIAGNGQFPLAFAKAARKRGIDVVAVGFKDETDPELASHVKSFTWIRVGALGKLLRIFSRAKVARATFVGGLHRPSLFKILRCDLQGFLFLAKLKSFHDDSLLSGLAGVLESRGIEVFSAFEFMSEAIPALGVLTNRGLTPRERKDAIVGWRAARGVGALDIGQTVVVADRTVTAVESIEGTDMTIARAGDLTDRQKVVVKLCKPQQDIRLDLPAIGVKTIETMRAVGATALVIEAGKSVIHDPAAVLAAANAADIAIIAAEKIDELP